MKNLLVSIAALALAGAAAPASSASAPKPGTTFRDCDECSEMVVIKPGSFMMGAEGGEPDRYEGPVHPVKIDYSFAVGVTPVTIAEYRAFVKDTNYQAAQGCLLPSKGTYIPIPGSNWANPGIGRLAADNEPVMCINWNDAKAYVDWLAKKTGKPYRMMSEAEWEYVARAGQKTRYPWGDNAEDACKYTNLLDASGSPDVLQSGERTKCSDGYPDLAPVGRFPANAFGVRDMIGNVWTWTADCYEMPYPAAAPRDGRPYLDGPCDRRSVRGASWATTYSRARPTFRGRDPVEQLSPLFGLRVARDLK